jgi:phosphate starvation-inducible PhoH-like protein
MFDLRLQRGGMAEELIPIRSGEEALALFGRQDENLKRMHDRLQVRAVLRDGQLRISGEAEAVEKASAVVLQILARIRAGEAPEPDEVDALLSGRPRGGAPGDQAEDFRVQALRHSVKPRTPGQKKYVDAIRDHDIVFVIGPAGTGKSYLAVAAGVKSMRKGVHKKLILARPAVEAGEKLGFLPGDFLDKVNPYIKPLYDALEDFLEPADIRKYIDQEVFEVVPIAFMRGRTLNDAFIIMDEAQNATVKQMKMFLTRLGRNSKAVITGDVTQIDLAPDQPSGLVHALETLHGIPGIAFRELTNADIFRHKLVGEIVDAYRAAEEAGREGGGATEDEHEDEDAPEGGNEDEGTS